MDIFIEKIVKRRKTPTDIAFAVLMVLVALILSFVAFTFLQSFAIVVVFGIGYLAYILITRRNIEYEYSVTNGDLDIDMIANQRKRKRVFSMSCKEFEVVAKVKSAQYTHEMKECKTVKDFTSLSPNADIWFIFHRQGGTPTVVLFEPTSQMIDNFRTFIPRKVFQY